MDIKRYVNDLALEARAGARALGRATTGQKDEALRRMAEALKKRAGELIKQNRKDIAYAEKKGLSRALIDRLSLNEKRINEMAQG
ncbi:MAG: gamma-glutamyl-phosphate reductase, partial [Candidatus Dadabacteria bacterium]